MNVAIIGLGKMGKYHYKACKGLGHNILHCDTNLKLLGYDGYANYKSMPVDNLDAVIIATPTPTHYEIAKYFIECKGNIKVFIEKPMCEQSIQAYYLMEMAKRKGVQLMVGHIERFNPIMKNVTNFYAGAIRDIVTVRRGYTPEVTSNIISDVMIHDIDNVCYMLNYNKVPRHIHSIVKGNHFAHALMEYNGVLVTHQVDRKSNHITREIRMTTNEYYYHIDLLNKSLNIYNNVDENPCYGEQSNDDALRAELRAFFDGYDNAKQACRNVKTCENIIRGSIKWKKE